MTPDMCDGLISPYLCKKFATMESSFNNPHRAYREFERRNNRGRIVGGLLLVLAGSVWLAKSSGFQLPEWLFGFHSILILIGLYLIGKNGVQKPGGPILLALGILFLIEKVNPELQIGHIIWPLAIIAAGLMMLLQPWRRRNANLYARGGVHLGVDESTPDRLSVNAMFGGAKKRVVSSHFEGGEVNCFFGGARVDLSQADLQGVVSLEINSVFGGVEIIVPGNWRVQNDITAVLGGVSDRRPFTAGDAEKVLRIHGSAVFGGVEVK